MVLIISGVRKFICISLCIIAAFNFCAAAAAAQNNVSAKSAVLMCDGQLLYSKNENCRMPMASTTKIMTAIVTIENSQPEQIVEISNDCCGVEGSSMYLKAGTSKTVFELLKGLMLVSGNDAALALAKHVSGDTDSFVELMNKKAKELGMSDTHFVNPHGLNESGHYSTAKDLAVLMEYCMNNKFFSELVKMKSFENDGAVLLNHNKLLFIYPGCVGGKTGYTEAAGRCLVSACEKKGVRLICVTLSAPDDWNDHKMLYDWCYNSYSLRDLTKAIYFDIPVAGAENNTVRIVPENEVKLFVKNTADVRVEFNIPWFIFAPAKRGDRCGYGTILVDGKSAGEYYLICSEDYSLQ